MINRFLTGVSEEDRREMHHRLRLQNSVKNVVVKPDHCQSGHLQRWQQIHAAAAGVVFEQQLPQ